MGNREHFNSKHQKDRMFKTRTIDRFGNSHEGKPQKNRFMCPTAKKMKQLYQTEKEAETFIKFNRDKLVYGGLELRAYPCRSCAGWHVSSKPYKKYYDNITERLIAAAHKDKLSRDWISEAMVIWCRLEEDVRCLPQKEFGRYLKINLGIDLGSAIYSQGLLKLHNQVQLAS